MKKHNFFINLVAPVETKVQEKAKPTQKPTVQVNNSKSSTSPKAQRPTQAPQPQRLQKELSPQQQAPVSSTSTQQLNAYEAAKALNSNNESQKVGVVNPVVVNKAPIIGNKDSSILNNLPLETNNVSSLPNVLAGLPKVDLITNNSALNQQKYLL